MKLPTSEDIANAEKMIAWLEPMVPLLQGIYDGTHKIVPVEPTINMTAAGQQVVWKGGARAGPVSVQVTTSTFNDIYRAMIGAST